jgi:circadian clock protein KaiC
MRGSHHDSSIRQYTIDESGMHIGEPFKHVVGILSGNPTWNLDGSEDER